MSKTQFDSYSSTQVGLAARVRELAHLARRQWSQHEALVTMTLERLARDEAFIEKHTGMRLEGKRILEVGPGQLLRQMRYFSLKNEVVGIDLDVIAQGWSPLPYLSMLRTNGATRVLKTVGRKVLGVDGRFQTELAKRVNGALPKRLDVRQMNAEAMTFPDASFDVVVSWAAFEHLPNPGRVLEEIKRVLKPGGVSYIVLHLFTSDSGCHDQAIFSGHRDHLPLWSHLRPAHAEKVQPNSYLNRLRLDEWYKIFPEVMPGTVFDLHQHDLPYSERLATIRAGGELADYRDDELLTTDLAAVWKKPE